MAVDGDDPFTSRPPIRDANEIEAEIVAGFREAVERATAATAGQQQQAATYLVSGLGVVEGAVVQPGRADPPNL